VAWASLLTRRGRSGTTVGRYAGSSPIFFEPPLRRPIGTAARVIRIELESKA
jgi:hypothetical protein